MTTSETPKTAMLRVFGATALALALLLGIQAWASASVIEAAGVSIGSTLGNSVSLRQYPQSLKDLYGRMRPHAAHRPKA